MSLTIQQKIDIGNASSIFTSNELSGGKLHGGTIDKKLPTLIYLVRQGLEWLYELDPTHEDLVPISNYLIAICRHSARAELAIVGGGSTPTISGVSAPAQLNFTVAASGTTLIDGQSTVTLTQFIGYNLVVVKSGTGLTQITTAPVYYTWDKVAGLLTVVPAAFLGDEFQITPV